MHRVLDPEPGLNRPKMDPAEVARRRAKAEILLHFAVEIYEMQLRARRRFIHEHPLSASSWEDLRVARLRARLGVHVVAADLCMHPRRSRPSS